MSDSAVPDDARQVGRPSKYSHEIVERLCGALADGLPVKSACVIAGIGVSTLSDWREQHPELEDRFVEAREFARQNALSAIGQAGGKDWRAHAEWLRLTFPTDYRGTGGKVAISATAIANVSGPIMTEERLDELQRARQRLLMKENAENASNSSESQ